MKSYCISSSIILGIKEFGESDLIVTFFSEDKGILKGVAKGGKRSLKRFPNCLDHFCLTTVEYEEKASRPLSFLHSCRLINAFDGIRRDFRSLSAASYMVELTSVLFPPAIADKKMFDLLKNSLSALNDGFNVDMVRLVFEIKAMALGGYKINLERCCCCKRSYQGLGKAIYIRSCGGIACLKCKRETDQTPVLEPEAGMLLKDIYSSDTDIKEMEKVDHQVIEQVDKVMRLHIEFCLGKRLRTRRYIDMV